MANYSFRQREWSDFEKSFNELLRQPEEIEFSEPHEEDMKSIIDREFKDRLRHAYMSSKEVIDSYAITGLEITDREIRHIVQQNVGVEFSWLRRRVEGIFIDEIIEKINLEKSS